MVPETSGDLCWRLSTRLSAEVPRDEGRRRVTQWIHDVTRPDVRIGFEAGDVPVPGGGRACAVFLDRDTYARLRRRCAGTIPEEAVSVGIEGLHWTGFAGVDGAAVAIPLAATLKQLNEIPLEPLC